jgi:Tol biopolymer transport system component
VHLFVIPATGGTVRALSVGDLDLHGEPAWMPDGQSILYSAAPPPDAAHPLEGGEIYAVRIAGGERRQITRHPGPDETPVPSPDGSRIAWIAREPTAQSYVTTKLYVANPDGSRAKVLAGALDRDVSTCNGATIRVPCTSWPTIAAPPASTPRATMARCAP